MARLRSDVFISLSMPRYMHRPTWIPRVDLQKYCKLEWRASSSAMDIPHVVSQIVPPAVYTATSFDGADMGFRMSVFVPEVPSQLRSTAEGPSVCTVRIGTSELPSIACR